MDVGRTRSQGMDYLQVLMDQLVTDEILFPEEADMVDRTRLLAFAESSLGQRIADSRLVYRERPFNLLTVYEGKQIDVYKRQAAHAAGRHLGRPAGRKGAPGGRLPA